jgi:hypothetical protein
MDEENTMKLHELAKHLKMNSKELLREMADPRVTSHLSTVPEDMVAYYMGGEKKTEAGQAAAAVADTAEVERVVETPVAIEPATELACPVDVDTIKASIRGAGNKSPYWQWRALANG